VWFNSTSERSGEKRGSIPPPRCCSWEALSVRDLFAERLEPLEDRTGRWLRDESFVRDEILHHVRLHGEATIRIAGDRYRVTFDAAGNVSSELLKDLA
jgi:hypothetical protein